MEKEDKEYCMTEKETYPTQKTNRQRLKATGGWFIYS